LWPSGSCSSGIRGRAGQSQLVTDAVIMIVTLVFGIRVTMKARYTSNVAKNLLSAISSMAPPSGSTFSMHLAIAIMWAGSFELIHTRPLRPIAASNGNFAPR
jgi:hypothetical protein